MGSLMAGWSTTPPCAKKMIKRTTSSLTKDELNRYWRAKSTKRREHLEEAHRAAALARTRSLNTMNLDLPEEDEDCLSDSNSESESQSTSQPTSPTANEGGDENSKDSWWRRSSYAFLNEPPLTETRKNTYVAQFNVPTFDVRGEMVEMENSHGGHLHHTGSSSSIF